VKKVFIIRAFSLVLMLFSLIACQRDTAPAPLVEQIIEQLKQELNQRVVNRVVATDDPNLYLVLVYQQTTSGKSYQFKSPFIIIDGQSWNLSMLKRYEVVRLANDNTVLGLLF
jgi:hypothetical protein